jgi:hypothetical protein
MLPPRLVIALATLAAVALTARLGWWQLDRAAQKRAIAAAIAERGALPPLTALPAAEPASAVLHRRAALAGRWQGPHTVYLENRQMGGRPGFYVVTPLELADGSAVAVQRGWLPRDARERARLPAVPSPEGGSRRRRRGFTSSRPVRPACCGRIWTSARTRAKHGLHCAQTCRCCRPKRRPRPTACDVTGRWSTPASVNTTVMRSSGSV